ncbi:insulin-like 5a [Pristis pectinata]|uniref:insulin-like 5a n=1 Tax=Pristis pectinata TaxID=685728 RepID=UPI00223D667D|nr:insulin-like 5a [Pristis pectinata]
MRSMLLLPPLLALLAVSRVSPEKPILFRLCGRELMRAVIYTCGGSRWRRGTGTGGETALGANRMLEDQKSPFMGFHLPKRHLNQGLASSSGEDLSYRRDLLEEMLTAFQNPSREKRKFNQTHADLCCLRGCTKKQVSFLC